MTGTPASKTASFDDMFSIFKFLDLDFPQKWLGWLSKSTSTYVRHELSPYIHAESQANVQSQIQVPPQTDHNVVLSFTKIERLHYEDIYEKASTNIKKLFENWTRNLEESNRAAIRIGDGSGTTNDRLIIRTTSDILETLKDMMRRHILDLRQTACYPKIINAQSTMNTVEAVLTIMEKKCAAEIYKSERLVVIGNLSEHHFLTVVSKDWEQARKVLYKELNLVEKKCTLLNTEIVALKTKKTQDSYSDSDFEEEQINLDEFDRDTTVFQRLRVWQELQHRLLFFLASNYHLDETHPQGNQLENEFFEKARQLRIKILAERQSTIKRSIDFNKQRFVELGKDMKKKEHSLSTKGFYGGILTPAIFEKFVELFDILNENLAIIEEWRYEIISALFSPVGEVDEDGIVATGEEFNEGLEKQEMAVIYQDAYTELISFRRNLLDRVALPQQPSRTSVWEPTSTLPDKERELHEQIEICRPRTSTNIYKELLFKLAELQNHRFISDKESEFVRLSYKTLNDQYVVARNLQTRLEGELATFRQIFNKRICYFVQLNVISDGVTSPEMVGVDLNESRQRNLDEVAINMKIVDKLQAKIRYLKHLEQETIKSNDEADHECRICTDSFTDGRITSCGHMYCICNYGY